MLTFKLTNSRSIYMYLKYFNYISYCQANGHSNRGLYFEKKNVNIYII